MSGIDFGVANVEFSLETGKLVSVSGSCTYCHKAGSDLEPFVRPSTGLLSGKCRQDCQGRW